MVCAFAWTLANRGSKFWQENWEKKVEDAERGILGEFFGVQDSFDSKRWLGARRFSVSDLATALSDYVFVLWLIAVINQIVLVSFRYKLPRHHLVWANAVIPVLSIVYLAYMYRISRRAMPNSEAAVVNPVDSPPPSERS
jgi:hypothetical protein